MPEAKFHTATVVLGMHRSGTSALTGLLGQCGLDLPSKLIAPSETNERGFLESPTVTALNDDILRHHGLNWHNLTGIDGHWAQSLPFAAYVQKARDLIEAEYSEATNPLIKDPRICRLVNIWTAAFDGLATRTVFPIIIRNPLEVASSLSSRNGFEIELGLLLWARYYLDAERLTRGQPRCFIRYSTLLEDWAGTLTRLQQTLSLPLDPKKVEAANANAFISTDLQHHKSTEAQTFSNLDHAPLLLDAYRTLSSWADRKEETAQEYKRLDNALAALNQMSGLLADAFERARLDRKRMSAIKDKADATSDSLDRANEALQTLAADREVSSRFGENLQKIATTQETIAERFDVLSTAFDRNAETIAQERLAAGRMQDVVSDWRTEQRHAFDETNRMLAELVATGQSRKTLERHLAQSEAERATLQRKIDEISGLAEQLKEDIALHQHEIQAQAKDQQDQLRAIQDNMESAAKELKSVKRKYRSTQFSLKQSQDRETLIRGQLLETQRSLAYYRQPFPCRAWKTVRESSKTLSRHLFSSFAPTKKRKFDHWSAVIARSALFDEQWYLTTYPDVAAAGIGAAPHYAQFGWKEGRDPGPKFSTNAYLKQNADVDAAGINPLVHFVEFGETEGREIKAYSPVPKPLAQMDFGPAAPCPQFPLEPDLPTCWNRHYSLDAEDRNVLRFGDVVVGYIAPDGLPLHVADAMTRFEHLSARPSANVRPAAIANSTSPAFFNLIDAWFAGNGIFRMRCGTTGNDYPFAIRAFQYGLDDGLPQLVGEGLVQSALDLTDLYLQNSYAPVILFATKPDGLLLDARLLAFPSLCRGGRHHSELLALSEDEGMTASIDILAIAERLSNRLAEIETGRERAKLNRIVVNLNGADGSEALFQPQVSAWLAKVMHISVEAELDAKDADDATSEYLREAIAVQAIQSWREGPAALHLSGCMVPTISGLCAVEGEGEASPDAPHASFAMISERKYAGESALFVTVPADDEPSSLSAPDYPTLFPKIIGSTLRQDIPNLALAIRTAAHSRLTSAEMLFPVAPPALRNVHDDARPAITLLLEPSVWDEEYLAQSLKALSLQDSVGDVHLAYIGQPTASTILLSSELFGRKWFYEPDIDKALQAVETPFVCHIGAGVILHDARTLSVLHALLTHKRALSASCILMECHERGKSWIVTPADAGDVAYADGTASPMIEDFGSVCQSLWRAAYPIASPPRDLWMTHGSTAREWLGTNDDAPDSVKRHLSTSFVTASYAGKRSPAVSPLIVPPTLVGQSLHIKKIT